MLKYIEYITEISKWKKSWVNEDWERKVGSEYPPHEILEYVETFHGQDGDTDFYERIMSHDKFILKEIDINTLDLDEYQLDPEKVDEYKLDFNKYKKYPPIVIDDENSIIDGLHRANALSELGYNNIKVYVGDGSPEL
jgi:hypothetical protein